MNARMRRSRGCGRPGAATVPFDDRFAACRVCGVFGRHGAVRRSTGARRYAVHRRRDRPGHRRLRAPRAGGRRQGGRAARRVDARHAGRARHVDAIDRAGHPRIAHAGRCIRRTFGRAGGKRGHVHPLRQPRRGHGAGHQSRRRVAGADRHRVSRRPNRLARPTSRRSLCPRMCTNARLSPTPRRTSAASRNCAGAMRSGAKRRFSMRRACPRPKRANRRLSS